MPYNYLKWSRVAGRWMLGGGKDMLIGECRHSVDAKGRLIFPARFLEEMGERLILCRGLEKNIMVHSPSAWEAFCTKIDALPFTEARKLRQYFIAKAADCQVDSQGRLVVPQFMRDYADLGKDVFVVGMSDIVEIWNAEEWLAKESEQKGEDIAAIMERNRF